MARAMNLGMPRIGPGRELKRAVEAYWGGGATAADLAAAASARRDDAWQLQASIGIESIPCNDFSLYDHVLDLCCLVGAVPDRFTSLWSAGELDRYFAMARGTETSAGPVRPLEMTKWFDTNYHYLVPELGPDAQFRPGWTKPLDEHAEARRLGVPTRPVLVGPVSFLLLAKPTVAGFAPIDLLPALLPVYQQVLAGLSQAGCEWVQLDEPFLVTDLSLAQRTAFADAYRSLASGRRPRCLLATYFGGLDDNLELAAGLPVDGLHVDLVRDPAQLPALLDRLPRGAVLSAGVVDGRNVWRSDLRRSMALLEPAQDLLGDRLWVGPSCSLQHVPHDLELETGLDPRLRSWLAFARQKLEEIVLLARGLSDGSDAIEAELAVSDRAAADRRAAGAEQAVSRPVAAAARPAAAASQPGVASVQPVPAPARRSSSPELRRRAQQRATSLPDLPVTTIGSFPQTAEIRRARQQHASGHLSDEAYGRFCEAEIERVIRAQESVGLDVLVHGEPERNDMVQYFGERLDGFAVTRHGWVQSYGTRYVRPPILYRDVTRPSPITVRWLRYAQSLTASPVKGMLTGPVTILQWSFVRDDQPRPQTCEQIGLAIRDEIADLEAAGIRIIQVDEPALREGMPLRRRDRATYLDWATGCFRLATAGVSDGTQIHTHMCYAEFGDIIDAIHALDADVISIEAARSGMGVLTQLAASDHQAGIGPGVWDIHAPHVPAAREVAELIEQALAALPADRLWVNPDCGLKTRSWEEILPALANMATAAQSVRKRVAKQ
jgi:5-methyltetrahydropteroyltriglutamate--homocysteine methyltransferase